jgi:hypothetical protein
MQIFVDRPVAIFTTIELEKNVSALDKSCPKFFSPEKNPEITPCGHQ